VLDGEERIVLAVRRRVAPRRGPRRTLALGRRRRGDVDHSDERWRGTRGRSGSCCIGERGRIWIAAPPLGLGLDIIVRTRRRRRAPGLAHDGLRGDGDRGHGGGGGGSVRPVRSGGTAPVQRSAQPTEVVVRPEEEHEEHERKDGWGRACRRSEGGGFEEWPGPGPGRLRLVRMRWQWSARVSQRNDVDADLRVEELP
jgi:hypothetical protein